MACGMLHLFGYQLPETHHHYLLAIGFTDYWRRINIYWKDFMVRVVFNPVVFRLKRRPRWVALAVATAAVFLTTWAARLPDVLAQGGLGLQRARHPVLGHPRASWCWSTSSWTRGRSPGSRTSPSDGRSIAVRSVKTLATFVAISLLWSLWSSPSLAAWVGMFRRAFAG